VESFLATAGGEPLTWEAKGTELPRPEQITRAVCGFANAVGGGYLLLGFEQDASKWKATGVDFPNNDAPVWIATIVRNTLRPAPRVDVRDWAAGGKRAAVVQIQPVAEPPCITSGGQVFERVSGATVPVREPSDLRSLYARGHAATAQAEAAALRAAAFGEILEPPEPPYIVVGLTVAAVGHPPDISSRLFVPSFVERLIHAVQAFPTEPLFFEDFGTQGATAFAQQDAVVATTTGEARQTWNIRAAWDGSVAGFLSALPGEEERQGRIMADALVSACITPLAKLVSELVPVLGGYGRSHLVLRILSRGFKLSNGTLVRDIPGPNTIEPIRRWTDGEPTVDDHHLESMKRELLRACSLPAWEPEP
jgi:hypothetical protein